MGVCHPERSEGTAFAVPLSFRHDRRIHRITDRFQPDEFELLARILGNLLEIGSIARRQKYRADSRAKRGEHLLLDATDGQHKPAQADLARHRAIAPHGPVGHQRRERGEHRDARARSVLWNGAGRDVDVNIAFFE